MKSFISIALMAGALSSSPLLSYSNTCSNEVSNCPEKTTEVRPLLYGALTYGGDNLLEVEFDDGSSDEIQAGDMIGFGAGLLVDAPQNNFQFLAGFGYGFTRVDASNGSSQLDKFTFDLVPYFAKGGHRFGVGATLHTAIELESDFDFGDNLTLEFKPATGFLIEYGYVWNSDAGFSLRYTNIEYELERVNGQDIGYFYYGSPIFDATNIGLFGYLLF